MTDLSLIGVVMGYKGLAAALVVSLAVVSTTGVSGATQVSVRHEQKALFKSTSEERIKSLRIAGCVSEADPVSGKVKVSVRALVPDDAVPNGCVATPLAPEATTQSPLRQQDDENYGEQVLGEFPVSEVPKQGTAWACRFSGSEALMAIAGLGNAKPDYCIELLPGKTYHLS
ncbi:hypothetical protein AB0I60_26795 [Actinosynnema sp. NPDC050436]|uniref:hypothetical protein n=1 Tax=Actinosynnema sp. NPDC050436 TaxID=3155659 RepID=UPI0033D3007F